MPATLRRHLSREYTRLSDRRRVAPSGNAFLAHPLSTVWIDAGMLDIARQLGRESPTPFYTGYLTLAEGRPRAAISLLEEAWARSGKRGNVFELLPATKLADALAQVGRVEEAATVLESATRQRAAVVHGGPTAGSLWLDARSDLLKLYRARGYVAAAAAIESELRSLLLVADDDFPPKVHVLASSVAAR
jgi:hypothetical protein